MNVHCAWMASVCVCVHMRMCVHVCVHAQVRMCAHTRVCMHAYRLLQLIQDIWRDGEVVADWKNAKVLPVPRKGDLQSCDNWLDISLLDLVGKFFA